MNVQEYAKLVLLGESLEDKLLSPNIITDFSVQNNFVNIPEYPGRSKRLQISNEQIKFPKKGSLAFDDKKGLALHFFANHELLAIEMMASAILMFDLKEDNEKFLKGLLKTISDEQKHFSLYKNRMNDFGVDFGDFPLGDFFWKQVHKLKSPSSFYALIALTFEAANLDFAEYYRDVFIDIEDDRTAKILDIVLEDEISHVAIGNNWLNKWKEDKDIWDFYLESLPNLITPARAKGMTFNRHARVKAGLKDTFIEKMEKYSDDFKVTKRKQW